MGVRQNIHHRNLKDVEHGNQQNTALSPGTCEGRAVPVSSQTPVEYL